MKTKKNSSKKLTVTISVIIAVVILSVAVIVVYLNQTNLSGKIKDTSKSITFEFDGNKAPGFWAADNNWSQFSDTGSSVVQRTIIQGTREVPGNCFVMFFYYNGDSDKDAIMMQLEASAVMGSDSLSLSKINTHELTMDTGEGLKHLQLNQYNLIGARSGGAASGIQFGVAKLNNGYMAIRGYCERSDQLESTLPVFRAVSLKN